MKKFRLVKIFTPLCLVAVCISGRPSLAQKGRLQMEGNAVHRAAKGEDYDLTDIDNHIDAGSELILEGGKLRLHGGRLVNNGTITIKPVYDDNGNPDISGAIQLYDGEIAGQGRIVVQEDAALSIGEELTTGVATNRHFRSGRIENHGTVIWGGKELTQCHRGFTFENHGDLRVVNTGALSARSAYDENGQFNNHGKIYGAGVINGALNNASDGEIIPGFDKDGNVPANSMAHAEALPSASLLTLTGDITLSSSTVTVNITSTYYGQLNVDASIYIGGGTLAIVPHGTINHQNYDIIVGADLAGDFARKPPNPPYTCYPRVQVGNSWAYRVKY